MKDSNRFSGLSQIFSLRNITIAGIVSAAAVTVIVGSTAYYYLKTPPDAVFVTTDEFPSDLSTHFTGDTLNDLVVQRLDKMMLIADSDGANGTASHSGIGLGLGSPKERLIPKTFSSSPSPIFKIKWKGWDLNFCRSLGMSLRAKKFIELRVIGEQGGWRLTASVKNLTDSSSAAAGSAPQAGGACAGLENCVDDLSAQILEFFDKRRLLEFCVKTNTSDSNRRISSLYEKTSTDALQAIDLVAWGDALFALNQFPQALQKYQDALLKDPGSCNAVRARGYLYYWLFTQGNALGNIQQAELDLRKGLDCGPRSEFIRTSLCHTLVLESNASGNTGLLVEAKEHCEKALQMDPQFVAAAVNIGYILDRQEKHEAALQYFNNLSSKYPTSGALFLNYGYLLYRKYLRDQSDDSLTQATAKTLRSWNLDQNSYATANNLGFFYYEREDYGRALSFWEKARTLDTSDAECIAGLALVAFKRQDVGNAKTLLTSARQMNAAYGDPSRLKRYNYWSDRAANDLAELIALP